MYPDMCVGFATWGPEAAALSNEEFSRILIRTDVEELVALLRPMETPSTPIFPFQDSSIFMLDRTESECLIPDELASDPFIAASVVNAAAYNPSLGSSAIPIITPTTESTIAYAFSSENPGLTQFDTFEEDNAGSMSQNDAVYDDVEDDDEKWVLSSEEHSNFLHDQKAFVNAVFRRFGTDKRRAVAAILRIVFQSQFFLD